MSKAAATKETSKSTIPKVKIEDIENDGGATDDEAPNGLDEPVVETEAEEAERRYVRFTPEKYAQQVEQQAEEKRKELERASQLQEGRLVDGTLVFGDGEEEDEDKREFDPFLQEGSNLPEDYPEFPKKLYGVPIEEIDSHIKDTVSV